MLLFFNILEDASWFYYSFNIFVKPLNVYFFLLLLMIFFFIPQEFELLLQNLLLFLIYYNIIYI